MVCMFKVLYSKCLNFDRYFDPANYGTRHVLVLADFMPSTTTMDLEKLLVDFKDRGVVIRWVNDTVALAVFRTPSNGIISYSCVNYNN